MADKHPLEDIVKEMSGEFKDLRKDARKSKVTPLGQEKVSAKEIRDRMNKMSPPGRGQLARQLIDQMGVEEFMKVARKRNDDQG